MSLDVSHIDYPSILIPPSSLLQGFASPLQVVKTMLKEFIVPNYVFMPLPYCKDETWILA
jgi:hypothetical protein